MISIHCKQFTPERLPVSLLTARWTIVRRNYDSQPFASLGGNSTQTPEQKRLTKGDSKDSPFFMLENGLHEMRPRVSQLSHKLTQVLKCPGSCSGYRPRVVFRLPATRRTLTFVSAAGKCSSSTNRVSESTGEIVVVQCTRSSVWQQHMIEDHGVGGSNPPECAKIISVKVIGSR